MLKRYHVFIAEVTNHYDDDFHYIYTSKYYICTSRSIPFSNTLYIHYMYVCKAQPARIYMNDTVYTRGRLVVQS